MADQQEIINSMLDDLASEVVALEPGDLMTYGEVLSRLEQLAIVCDGAGSPDLTTLASALTGHMEAMILGENPDQEQGMEVLSQGVSMGQALNRGDADHSALQGFLAGFGLSAGEAPESGNQAGEPEPDQAGAAAAPPPDKAEAEPPAPEVFSPEDEELLSSFVMEALEHLESIEVNTLLLEDNPQDQEALNAVFRPFHTIKGVSGFLNLQDINHLAHNLENLLDQARSEKLVVDSPAIDVVLAGVDVLRQMINDCQEAANEGRPRQVFNTEELESNVDQVIANGTATASQGGPEPPPLGEILVEKGDVPAEAVEEALAEQKAGATRPLGEILVSKGAAAPTQVAEGIRTQKAMASAARSGQPQEVKIDTAKLDFLLDMVGELVISQSMVQANPNVQSINDRKLSADMAQLSRITSDLQKTTMAMRMVPIKQTFQKMVRVVRDTAKKQGRKVKLKLEGEGTEIDRNMVEKFYDPLMHMVRNSVDHGIETPDEREAAGKPIVGEVVLAAYHKGGNVCIEIRDDGKGLARDKILAKGIERDMVDPADADTMSDDDVYHLIFQPGFSTVEKVTEISGRGVGMDVVQRTIDELRGKVTITSALGQGTSFVIALPLTLAIIDGMVVEVGDERYILPTVSVAESLRPRREDYNTVQGKGEMIMIRGNLLPLIRLHNIVKVQPEHNDPWEALVVVVEHHAQMRCLLVDRLIGRQEVVIKSLGDSLKGVRVVAGGAIMGDGRVGLILDIEGVFKSNDSRR